MRTARGLLIVLLAGLLGCAKGAEEIGPLLVAVGNRNVALPTAEWRPISDEVSYARNFEAVTNRPPRQYQILTIFLNQMSEDRKLGRQIAPNEFLEVFLSNPDEITVLVRRDHGSYWLLSREMFKGVAVPGVDGSRMRPLSDSDAEHVEDALRNEIDSTRHLLGERLVAR